MTFSTKTRPAQPGEGEVPIGSSEVPGGGPRAYTDPLTGERVIDEVVEETPAEVPKVRRRKQ